MVFKRWNTTQLASKIYNVNNILDTMSSERYNLDGRRIIIKFPTFMRKKKLRNQLLILCQTEKVAH